MVEEVLALYNTPHQKLLLRQRAIDDLLCDGRIVKKRYTELCTWKLKCQEWAKPGKFGRIIVDLGVESSLQGAPFAEYCKKRMVRSVYHKNSKFTFISAPKPDDMKAMFNDLYESPYDVNLYAFSDDATVAVREDGVLKWYDLDISSCDMSHQTSIFNLLFDAFEFPMHVRESVSDQILRDIIVRNPEKYKEYFILRPLVMYLQSGITITTLINTFSWWIMFLNIVDVGDFTQNGITTACAGCGYIVDIGHKDRFQKVTFLKHNPVRCTCCNSWQPVINIGVILRASGILKGEIPSTSRTSIDDAVRDHQSGVMNGLLSKIDNKTFEQLNPRSTDKVVKPDGFINLLHEGVKHKYTTNDLLDRYDFTESECLQLHEDIRETGLGYTCYSSLASRIFSTDYGLRTPLT
jgi:hypothetical protein